MFARISLFILLTACGLSIAPQQSYALFGFGGVGDTVTVVGDTSATSRQIAAQTSLMAGQQQALVTKEFQLDNIAKQIARQAIKQMVQQTINWINSGFQGSPAFVTDLGGFLRDIADQAAGEYIYGSELGFLCSPFELDVRIALATQYNESRSTASGNPAPRCTLSGVANNMENFLQGSFADGGWQSWFELTQGSTNDPNKAMFEAELGMYAAIRNAEGQEIKLLDWGDGFLSYKVCSDTDVATGAQTNCTITTPGRTIADQLNSALNVGRDELITADEINEVLGALLAQLSQQALTGAYGLLGLGGGGNSFSDNRFGDGNESYLDALVSSSSAPINTQSTGTIPGTSIPNPTPGTNTSSSTTTLTGNGLLDTAIKNSRDQVAALTKGITDIQTIERRITTSRQQYGRCFDVTLPADLTEMKDRFITNQTAEQTRLLALEEIATRYRTATQTNNIELQQTVLTELLAMQRDGRLTTRLDSLETELFIEYDLPNLLNKVERDITREINSCDDD